MCNGIACAQSQSTATRTGYYDTFDAFSYCIGWIAFCGQAKIISALQGRRRLDRPCFGRQSFVAKCEGSLLTMADFRLGAGHHQLCCASLRFWPPYLVVKLRREHHISQGKAINLAGRLPETTDHTNSMNFQFDFAYQILFALAVTTIKVSILFFYDRIFPMRSFRFCAIGVGILNIIWCIIFTVGLVFASKPTAYFWDHAIRNAKGVNEIPFGIGISVANVITDFIVLILPVPILWKLQMKKEKKIAVTAIFLLGGLYVCFYPSALVTPCLDMNLADTC